LFERTTIIMEPADRKYIADVTVAISTCDRADSLVHCLDALLSGTMLPGEMIVVDQSRDERTRLLLERYQSPESPLIYVRHDGSGLGRSQNIAIAKAGCSIVAVIDDDCVPTPEWLATIERAFAPRDQIDVLTGRVLPLGPERPGFYPVSSRTSAVRQTFDHRAMPWEIGSGNNFAAKRVWLRRIGGNDERLGPGSPGLGGVDMDLFYRFVRAGASVRYEPESLVYHERTSQVGRMARRVPYGYGMGACCAIWLRQGDRNAPRVFARWLAMRLRRLIGGVWRREWMLVCEEAMVLNGTFRGLLYGLCVNDAAHSTIFLAQDLSPMSERV
jgi:O-antigen biosynthesis protein